MKRKIICALLAAACTGKSEVPHPDLTTRDATADPLTRLPNRNYVRDSFGEQGIFNTTRYKALAMFDIDRFKAVNETRDGDSILRGVVELSKKAVDGRGLIIRWSGDALVFFLELEAAEAETRFAALCAQVKEQLDVTISVGIVEVDLSETIKTNYYRAVQACYTVKERGGNGVQRKT